jgi:hypothetical protein
VAKTAGKKVHARLEGLLKNAADLNGIRVLRGARTRTIIKQ